VSLIQHLRYLRLSDHLIGFYDGRIEGHRFAADDNWVDDGALSLGICSYAIVDQDEAIVYDTHVSLEHAAFIRSTVEKLGARKITVVLSHWHLDHVAGTEAFADCEVIANRETAALLTQYKTQIELGEHHGPPAINPLILPTRVFDETLDLACGSLRLELRKFDIHSRDATVLLMPDEGILLAGDTLEDTITYVAEPHGLSRHIEELDRLSALSFERIYPNHGDAAVIEAGGYGKTLIRATQQYVRSLRRTASDEALRAQPLQQLIAGPLQAGWINYYPPYELVHQNNLKAVVAATSS
jgi:glyoxylase-like metal-dependent hydrolase (beta-lactamase superfamily II)